MADGRWQVADGRWQMAEGMGDDGSVRKTCKPSPVFPGILSDGLRERTKPRSAFLKMKSKQCTPTAFALFFPPEERAGERTPGMATPLPTSLNAEQSATNLIMKTVLKRTL